MARYSLAQKQASFTSSILDMVGTKGWQGRASSLWHRYMDEFTNPDSEFFKSESTQKLYISKYRTSIKNAFAALEEEDPRKGMLDQVIKYIAFPEGLNERLYAQYQTKVKDRSRNLTIVNDFRAIVALFTRMLDDDNVRVRALAIMMLTGRRFYEVMTTADFAPVYQMRDRGKVRHKYLLEFSGQAKTREAEGTKFGESFRIPCLAPAQDIIAALKSIRESEEGQRWRGFDSAVMNSAESGRMNQMLRGLLAAEQINEPKIVETFTIKQMRSLYAEIAYEIFAPKTFSKAAYFSQILGHAVDDIKTSLSYMNYVLGSGEESIAKAQNEIQSAIEQANAADTAYEASKMSDDSVIDDSD